MDRLRKIIDNEYSDDSYDSQEIVSDTSSFGSIEDANSTKQNYHDDQPLKTILKLHSPVKFEEGCPPPLDIIPFEPGLTCNCNKFEQEECILQAWIDNNDGSDLINWNSIIEKSIILFQLIKSLPSLCSSQIVQ